MNYRKLIGAVIGIVSFVCTILIGVYAIYTWKSDNTDVTFNIGDSYFYCESGFDTTVKGLSPVLDYRNGSYHTFKVNNIGKSDTKFSVTLNITKADASLLVESFKYKLVVDKTGGSNNCADTSNSSCVELDSGNFSNMKVGMNTVAESVELPNNSRYQYYLFMYIDGNMENDTSMQNSSITSTLEVCEIVAFLDYNGGNVADSKEFLKVTSTYAGLPSTVTRDTSVVTYDSQGGSSLSSASVSYTFGGWFTESAFTNKVTSSSEVKTSINHTLYAKWNASGTVTLPTPTRTGYTFNGWYDKASGGNKIGNAGASYSPSKSITLYAHWTANKYTVSLNNQGATSSGTTSVTATYGSALPDITVPGKKYTVTYNYNGNGSSNTSADVAYTFGGYYTETGGSGTQYYNASGTSARNWDLASNTTLYANWTGSGTVTLPTPTRTGYTFNGWYTAAEGGTKVGDGGASYTPSSNVTLYAQWSINSYYIDLNWNVNGTTYGNGATYGSGRLKACLKVDGSDKGCVEDYYALASYGAKWEVYKLQLDGTDVAYTSSGTVGAGDVEIKTVIYTLDFTTNNSNYGSVSQSQFLMPKGYSYSTSGNTLTLSDGRSVTASLKSVVGYTISFSGWSSNSGTISSATTVTAKFTGSVNSYTFNVTKGTGVGTIYYRVNGASSYSSSTSNVSVSVKYGTTYYYYGAASTGYTMDSCTSSNPCSGTMGASDVTKSLTASDKTAPTTTLTSTSTLKSTTQTATLKCSDNGSGIAGYYWGTDSTYSNNTYTAGSMSSTTKSVNSAGTYYLTCKDNGGNVSSKSITYNSYNVQTMLLTISGTSGTYTTNNYDKYSLVAYIAPYNTTIVLSSLKGAIPADADTSTFKGYSVGAPSTSSATLVTSDQTLKSTTTYTLWYDRIVTTVTVKANTGGSLKVVSTQNTSGVTAASGESKTFDVRYGDTITATATANTGYTFKSLSGDITTNGGSLLVDDSLSTITATFADTIAPTTTLTSTSTLKATVQTATLKCSDSGSGIAGYYWGTNGTYSNNTYTSGSMSSTTKSVSSAGTYYLTCKDKDGNVSTKSLVYYSYTVQNMLLNVNGSAGTYTTNNYTQSSSSSYIALNGTSLTLASIYTIPTESTFKGVSTGAASTTAVTVSASAPTLSGNTTYAMWFDRKSYTLTIKPNGGKYNSTTSETTVTKIYDSNYGLLSPTRTGYTFTGWSLSGGGTLMRGSAASVLVDDSYKLWTYSTKTDSDGSQYTNYSLNYTNSTGGYVWPNLLFGHYSYTSGHTYRISFSVRIHSISGLGYVMMRHSAVGNDYSSYLVKKQFSSVTNDWETYSLERTFTGTTITLGDSELTMDPCIELYTQLSSGSTGVLNIDIKNLVVYDVTSGTYVTNDYYSDYIYKFGTSNATLTAQWQDKTNPTTTLTSTSTLKSSTQTATLNCSDSGSGIAGYYWGTSSTYTSNTYTSGSPSVTPTISSAGTYYLTCKDNAGNVSTKSITYNSYNVQNMLLNIKGSSGTYTTNHYTQSSAATYLAPNGTTITTSSVYTVPTGASASTFKGISVGWSSATAATLSTSSPKLSSNTTYAIWFDRITYTITATAGTGGTLKITSTQNTSGLTAPSGGSTTISVRYGDTITATATANTGYSLGSISGLVTTNGGTKTITSAGTVTASFTANTYTVTYRRSGNLMSSSSYTSSNKISITGTSKDTVKYYDDITVYLDAGKTYYAYGSSSGTWSTAHDTNAGSDTAVGMWLYNESASLHKLVPVNTGSFTVSTSGTYMLRLNVYNSGVTHTFWDLGVRLADVTTTVTYGGKYSVPTSPVLKGYTFNGWYTAESGGTQVTSSTTVTTASNHTLYAQWSENQAYIRYNVNGGTLASDNTRFTSTDSDGFIIDNNTGSALKHNAFKVGTLANWNSSDYINVTKTGYVAVSGSEWCTNADGTGTCYNHNTEYAKDDYCDTSNGNCTLDVYVNWTGMQLKVVFHKNISSSEDPTVYQTYTYGVETKRFGYNQDNSVRWAATDYRFGAWGKSGYKFLGWAWSASATAKDYNGNAHCNDSFLANHYYDNADHHIDLYAVWEKITLTVAAARFPGNSWTVGSCGTYNVEVHYQFTFTTNDTISSGRLCYSDSSSSTAPTDSTVCTSYSAGTCGNLGSSNYGKVYFESSTLWHAYRSKYCVYAYATTAGEATVGTFSCA